MKRALITAMAVSALALAGCGSASDSTQDEPSASGSASAPASASAGVDQAFLDAEPADQLSQALDTLRQQDGVHVTGTSGPLTEMDVMSEADNLRGALTLKGTPLEVALVDGTVYLNAPQSFWEGFGAPPDQAAKFDGEWINAGQNAQAVQGISNLSITGLATALEQVDGGTDKVTSDYDESTMQVTLNSAGGGALVIVGATKLPVSVMNGDTGTTASDISLSYDDVQPVEAPDASTPQELLGG